MVINKRNEGPQLQVEYCEHVTLYFIHDKVYVYVVLYRIYTKQVANFITVYGYVIQIYLKLFIRLTQSFM